MAYSVILDAIAHLALFDVMWFVNCIFSNLFWLFVFVAAAFLFFEGKHIVRYFLILVIYIWAFNDVAAMTGWIFGGLISLLYFCGAIFLEAWSKTDGWISKNYPAITSVFFIGLWVGSYFFFG